VNKGGLLWLSEETLIKADRRHAERARKSCHCGKLRKKVQRGHLRVIITTRHHETPKAEIEKIDPQGKKGSERRKKNKINRERKTQK